jgi:hypothetical protein
MTHRESIKEIRKQMATALGAGKIGEYLVLLSQLESLCLMQASVSADSEDEAMARMTAAYRGGL